MLLKLVRFLFQTGTPRNTLEEVTQFQLYKLTSRGVLKYTELKDLRETRRLCFTETAI